MFPSKPDSLTYAYMTRAHRVGGLSVAVLVAYLLIYFGLIPTPFVSEIVASQIIPTIPWWLLVSFGSYSLWTLGIGILTFRECPGAYHEVLSDINRAKTDLRSRGIQID